VKQSAPSFLEVGLREQFEISEMRMSLTIAVQWRKRRYFARTQVMKP